MERKQEEKKEEEEEEENDHDKDSVILVHGLDIYWERNSPAV